MKKNKSLYPGTAEAEKERIKAQKQIEEKPDFKCTGFGIVPNYEKFKSWNPEKVLVWLNID